MWPTNIEFRTKVAQHRNEQLKKLVESIDVLPSTARVPMRILELHRSPDVSLEHYAEALMADASLVTRVLSLANSAFAGQQRQVASLSEAVRLIGVNNLLPLLFGVSLAGQFNRADIGPSQRDALWKNALLKAIVARYFAAIQEPDLAETAFVCALLQDIAVPVMLACDPGAATEFMLAIDQESGPIDRERDLFGLSHAAVGRIIAERLNLPDVYVNAIGDHHDPATKPPAGVDPRLASALRIAAAVPHGAAGESNGLGERFIKQLIAEQPDTTPAAAKQTALALVKEFTRVLGLFGGKTPADNGTYRLFLQDVCHNVARTLNDAIGAAVQTVAQLESRITDLESKAVADADPLTGLLTPRAFAERAAQLFRLSADMHTHVGIGYADMDDFGRISADHGQPAADAALRALAGALKSAVGRRGIAARFGNDELVFLLVAEADASCEAATDAVKRVLRQQTCKVGDKSFSVSFSCGIQWLGVPSPQLNYEAALKRADDLMRSAKKSGKNRCIIQPNLRAAA